MTNPLNDYSMPNMVLSGTPVTKRVVTPLLPDSQQDLTCDEENGVLRIEGDIIVKEASDPSLWRRFLSAIRFGHGVGASDYLWPRGTIAYVVHAEVEELVHRAIAHWHARTPLRFVEWSGEFDYLSFEPGASNESMVGRQGDKQVVSLVRGTTLGWAVHEIGHAIGLWHEHSRPDQSDHIVVHTDNIRPGAERHFQVQLENARPIGAYDYDSAMHYPDDAFARPGTKSISRIDGQPLGPRQGLSAGDVASCQALYSQLDWSQVVP